MTRRHLFGRTSQGIGLAALASLMNPPASPGAPVSSAPVINKETGGLAGEVEQRHQAFAEFRGE